MARTGAMEDASLVDCSAKQGSSVCLRSRPCSSERDGHVRAVKAALQSRLGPYEPVLTYLQSVLVWERPFQCVLLYTVVNVVFWWVSADVKSNFSTFWWKTCSLSSVCYSVIATFIQTVEALWPLGENQRDCTQLVFLCNANVSPVNSRRHRWLASGTFYSHNLQTLLPSL